MNSLRKLTEKGYIVSQNPTRIYATNGRTYFEIRVLENILITITKYAREERKFERIEDLMNHISQAEKGKSNFFHNKLLPLWKEGVRNMVIEIEGSLVDGYSPFVSIDLGGGNYVKVYAENFIVNKKESTVEAALSISKRLRVMFYDDPL